MAVVLCLDSGRVLASPQKPYNRYFSTPIHLAGMVRYDDETRNGKLLITRRASFDLECIANRWLMMSVSKDKTNDVVKFVEAGSDGGDVCSYTELDPNAPDAEVGRISSDRLTGKSLFVRITNAVQRTRLLNSPGARGIGCISGGPNPIPGLDMLAPLWLTYCSGSYYRENSVKEMPGVWFIGDPRLLFYGYTEETRTTRSESHAPFFDRIEFFSDGITRVLTAKGPYSAREKAPYDKGFQNALLEVRAWTNFSGRWIPLQTELRLLVPKLTGHLSNDLDTVTRIYIDTTLCVNGSLRSTYLPKKRKGVSMVDYRFYRDKPSLPFVRYYSRKADDWPLREAVRKSLAYKSAMLRFYDPSVSTIRRYQKYLIGLILLAPITFVVALSNLRRRTQPQKQKVII